MSSFWTTMKKRRGSSNTNLTSAETAVGGKTPSGRSSASRDSRDDRGSRTTSGDSREEGLTNRVSRLAEQVLPRSGFRSLRLPPALSRGFATGSLPRHFPSRSVDSEMSTSPADTPQGKEESESKRPRGPLMGLSTDRFPAPLKNLLQRPRRGKPPRFPEKVPPKPSRRPGPVGKSWIKVYDDIIYMDDPSAEEIVPILGYTGYPTVVPDAEPLPVAPTPPPERMKPASFENIPRRMRELERGLTPSEDKENVPPNLTEIPKPPPPVARSGRSREISRYKGKRQKRSGTPIGRNISNANNEGKEEEVSRQGEDDTGEVMEDGYIIPQSLKPPKPPRGNKMYETINKIAEDKISKDKEVTGDEVPLPEVVVEPPKPKRGMKIYESIVIKVKDEGKTSPESDAKHPATETSSFNRSLESEKKGAVQPPKPKRGIKIYETIEIGFRIDPTKEQSSLKAAKRAEETKQEEGKPKREEGKPQNKEDRLTKREGDAGEMSPPKPTKKNKIYANVTKTSASMESTPLQGPEELSFQEERPKASDEGMTEGEVETVLKDGDTHLYTKVQKPPRSKDPTEDKGAAFPRDEKGIESSLPPPVPPKKRKQLLKQLQPVENVYDVLPCRPPRRLKSRPRSCGASPLRPKRHKMLPEFQENGLSPRKPPRGEKLKSCNNLAFDSDRASTLPLPRSKRRIMESSSFEDKEDEGIALPPKSMRNSQSRLLPAPPRRKKLDRSFEEDQVSVPKDEDQIQIQRHKDQIPVPKDGDNISFSRNKDQIPVPKDEDHIRISRNEDQILIPKAEEQVPAPKTQESAVQRCSFTGEIPTINAVNRVTPSAASLLLETNDTTPPPPPPKRSKLVSAATATGHLEAKTSLSSNLVKENGESESESVSESDSRSSSRLETRAVGYASSYVESQLDIDIENNLKKIEISFETLDTVIQSLKKYTSQGSLSEADKIVRSDDSLCDNLKPADTEHRREHEPNSEVSNEIDASKLKNVHNKEGNSGVSLDNEISDLSVADSEAETIIFVDKSSSQDSLNLVDNILNSTDLAEDKNDISDSAAIPSCLHSDLCRDSSEDEEDETEPRPIEISFVIKSDQPVTLPKLEDLQAKQAIREKGLTEPVVTSEIPLKLKTTEKSEFKFEPSVDDSTAEAKSVTSTEIPLKLSTTEKSEFKFEPSVDDNKAETTPVTSTEIPLKLSTTEKLEFKFEPSVDDNKAEAKPVASSEIPVKLSTTEKLEFKFEPSVDDNKAEAKPVTSTEIPLKLSTTEKSEFKLEPPVNGSITEGKSVTSTEIPIKLSTTEKSEFKFEQFVDNSKAEAKSVTSTEIPLKLSTTEKSEFKFETSVNDSIAEGKSVTSTEIPIQLSTTEKSEFKFEPSVDDSKAEAKSVTSTEIPLKLSTTEKSEFKFETSVNDSIAEGKSVTSTEIPIKLSTTEKSEFKFEPSVDDSKAEAKSVTSTEIPLKLSTTEKSEFKFEPSVDDNKAEAKPVTSTEIPLKLSTTEKSEFKLEPPVNGSITEGKSVTSTEIPIKLSTTEKSEFKFEQSVDDSKAEAKSVTSTEIPLKLSTTEKSEFKFEPSVDDNKAEAKLVTSTEIPLKLLTTEKSEFKFETSVKDSVAEGKSVTSTDIPIKLSTTEKSEFKFEPSVDGSKAEAKSVTSTEIPLKLSTTEKSEFKFEPSVDDNKAEAKPVTSTEIPLKLSTTEKSEFKLEPPVNGSITEGKSVTSTEIPIKLSTTEKSEFKFEQSVDDSKAEAKSVTSTEIPLKLSTTEKSEFKFETSVNDSIAEGKSVTSTEIPIKLSTTKKSEFKFEQSVDDSKAEAKSVTSTEIPLKLSTTEKSEFKFETSVNDSIAEGKSVTSTEIPIKLSTTEKSEFTFEPSVDDSKAEAKSVTITEIPLKISTTEKTEFKFEPSVDDNKAEAKPVTSTEIPLKLSTKEKSEFKFETSLNDSIAETTPVTSTEIPIKLSTTEKSEFKFEPSVDGSKAESKSVTSTEIPLKLSTIEKSEFKFESSVNDSIAEGKSVTSTEIPIKLSTREKSVFKFEPSVDDSKAEAKSVTNTEIPLKLSTKEKSEFKFESEVKSLQGTELIPFFPLSLEARKKNPVNQRLYFEEAAFTESPEPETPVCKGPPQSIPIFDLSTKLTLFAPSLLISEKESLSPKDFLSSFPPKLAESKPEVEPKLRKTVTSFDAISPTQLFPFSPQLLEGRAAISESQKHLEQAYRPSISETTEEYERSFKPIPVHNFPPTDLLYFCPSLLRSEKQVADVTSYTLPRLSEPYISKVDHKSESESESYLPPSVQGPSTFVSFDSLSPTHLTLFSPTLLEAKNELSDNQKCYLLEETLVATAPLHLEFLDYIKSIPFYDLPPTDLLPFSPRLLVGEEELGDILTPKATTPEPKSLSIPLISESVADPPGTSELAHRLEGIHSQLEAIITNYPTSTNSSFDTALSDVSNRSSLCLDFPAGLRDSPLSSSFYSPTTELGQPNYSLCSTPLTFYTATTPSEKSFLTDSGTNTPGSSSNSSLKADDDYEDEIEDECMTASVQKDDNQREF